MAQSVPGLNKLVNTDNTHIKDGKVSYVNLKKASRQIGEAKEEITARELGEKNLLNRTLLNY